MKKRCKKEKGENNFQEQSYLISFLFDFFFFEKLKKNLVCFPFNGGQKIVSQTFFKPIWVLDSFFSKRDKTYFFAVVLKDTQKISKFSKDHIQIFQFSRKKIMKKKSFLYLKEEIWEIKWIKNEKKNRGLICFCSGYNIKIFEMPKNFPQHLGIFFSPISINLAGIFQWKFCLKNFSLASGDISGKIVLYKLKNGLFLKKILGKAHGKSAIICINYHGDIKRGEKYLISGGMDGFVKIWDLSGELKPIFQINFFNRKILSIDSNMVYFSLPLIFVGLDNGFFSIISLGKNFDTEIFFNHQGSLTKLLIYKNKLLSIGEGGDLVIGEIILPLKHRNFRLNLEFLSKILFKKNFKSNLKNFILEDGGTRYLNTILKIYRLDPENFVLQVGGHSGVLISYNLRKFK